MKIPSKKQIIMQLFNFQYGGIIDVHISTNKNNYVVSTKGFEIGYNGELELKKDSIIRKHYKDLQEAILVFSALTKEVCEAFSFFKYHYFDSEEFKQNALKGIFK